LFGARISAGRCVLDHLGHGEGLAGAGDAEQHLVRSLRSMPSTSSLMAVGWSPWVSYPDMVLLADATPVMIETTQEARFKITPEQLERAITPRTKMIWLNSPSEPVGHGLHQGRADRARRGAAQAPADPDLLGRHVREDPVDRRALQPTSSTPARICTTAP
jgi:hypothetical protein